MLGIRIKSTFVLLIMAVVIAAAAPACAESLFASYDPCVGAQLDCTPGSKAVTKVKPVPEPVPSVPIIPGTAPFKVKNATSAAAPRDLSQYNPANWFGADCCLPMLAKGQFWLGPKLTFARIAGEVRRGPDLAASQTSLVTFEDHLNFKRTGNAIWGIEAIYQMRPRWGFRYSFAPINIEASGLLKTSFNFGGQTFASGTQVTSKWDRYQHRAGLFFNVNRTLNSQTNVFADWINVSDKLSIGGAGGIGTLAVWNDTKNMALLGVEFEKCLRNYHGNTLAFTGKGGVAFSNDGIGYEAEAALSYLIPIKTGRFGFVRGGYSYATFKKDHNNEVFGTTIDGPFVQAGFLF